jgi:hypothetical protein
MAIITLPAAAKIRRIEWTLDRPAQVNRSDWTKRQQVVQQPGPSLWSAVVDLVTKVSEDAALEVEAFLVDLEGPINTFRLEAVENAQAPVGFAPVVNGGGQSGRTLNFRAGTAGQEFKRGHKFTVNEQMLMLMAPLTVGGGGTGTFSFKPSLRVSPADGTAIECRRPTVMMRLAGSQIGWSVDPGQVYQMKQLVLEESL